MSHVSRVQTLFGAKSPALGPAVLPTAGGVQPGQVHLDSLPANWLGSAGQCAEKPWTVAARRILDVALSLALLAFTLPLTLLLAYLVRLDSPGPTFYRQERVGLHGRSFQLLKFRSMRMDAEAAGPSWAMQADPRVTRLGRIMRLTRMDELPQLLNVLAGSMSLVGPRPERPCFVTQLAEQIPHFHERTKVKPGITGWAQISYPYGASIEDARNKLAYDLYYLQHRSLTLDLRILLATVRVVVMQVGAR
jgi:exopolysaccharide biosynthesis polyprenyl glycosylphosphotransferase